MVEGVLLLRSHVILLVLVLGGFAVSRVRGCDRARMVWSWSRLVYVCVSSMDVWVFVLFCCGARLRSRCGCWVCWVRGSSVGTEMRGREKVRVACVGVCVAGSLGEVWWKRSCRAVALVLVCVYEVMGCCVLWGEEKCWMVES